MGSKEWGVGAGKYYVVFFKKHCISLILGVAYHDNFQARNADLLS